MLTNHLKEVISYRSDSSFDGQKLLLFFALAFCVTSPWRECVHGMCFVGVRWSDDAYSLLVDNLWWWTKRTSWTRWRKTCASCRVASTRTCAPPGEVTCTMRCWGQPLGDSISTLQIRGKALPRQLIRILRFCQKCFETTVLLLWALTCANLSRHPPLAMWSSLCCQVEGRCEHGGAGLRAAGLHAGEARLRAAAERDDRPRQRRRAGQSLRVFEIDNYSETCLLLFWLQKFVRQWLPRVFLAADHSHEQREVFHPRNTVPSVRRGNTGDGVVGGHRALHRKPRWRCVRLVCRAIVVERKHSVFLTHQKWNLWSTECVFVFL